MRFCTISAHQGKFISSRSERSVLAEIEKVTRMEGFKGYISDIGGPSANMYGMGGRDTSLCSRCTRPSCLHPKPCPNLDNSHARLLALYRRATEIKGVKKAFIGSGIRYDLFDRSDGGAYLREVVVNHTSGRLKVAPEHTEDEVLKAMRKPSFALFRELNAQFNDICRREGLRYQAHPLFHIEPSGLHRSRHGTPLGNHALARLPAGAGTGPYSHPHDAQFRDVLYGERPLHGTSLYVAKSQDEKRRQKSYFFRNADGTLRSDQLVPRRGKHGQSHPSRPAAPKPDRQNEHPTGKGRDTAQAIRRAFGEYDTARNDRNSGRPGHGGPDRFSAAAGKKPKGRNR